MSFSGNWAVLDMLDVALAVSNASKYNLDVAQLFAMKLVDCYCTPICLLRGSLRSHSYDYSQ